MTLLQAYLQSPKARRALSKRPGDKGFSLIELVVVVAILAILAAVALPNFLGVSKDGQIAAAKNTLATIAKECAVKETRTGSGTIGTTGGSGTTSAIQAMSGNLNGYIITTDADPSNASANNQVILGTTGAGTTCYTATAKSDGGTLPNFTVSFNPQTGVTSKTCHGQQTATYLEGCLNANGSGAVVANNNTAGIW